MKLAGKLGFSEPELRADKDQVFNKIAAHPDVAAVSASYDVRGVIEVEVQLKPAVTSTDGLRRELAGLYSPPTGARVQVDFRSDVGGVPQDSYIRGGGYLNGICTTGFNVTRFLGGRQYRSTTAKHCLGSGTETYSNHGNDSGSTQVGNDVWRRDSTGDWAVNTTGSFTATRTFYYTHTQKRYVEKVGTPASGVRVCHYGKTSNEKCDNIDKVGVSVTAPGGVNVGNLVRTDHGYSYGGDSGGPWYYGAVAYGTHMGITSDDAHSLFTNINVFDGGASGYRVFMRI